MAHAVNAGARLDRLPISSFHYRIFLLVGAGMFFDGYDLYIAGGVLASALQTKFSTVQQNLQFISLTFVGMTLGALITGFVGDKFGRRFTYQINLLIFALRHPETLSILETIRDLVTTAPADDTMDAAQLKVAEDSP